MKIKTRRSKLNRFSYRSKQRMYIRWLLAGKCLASNGTHLKDDRISDRRPMQSCLLSSVRMSPFSYPTYTVN